jgi:hypothetical protein
MTEESTFDSWQGQDISLFSAAPGLPLARTQPPTQGIPDAFHQGLNRPKREADPSPVSCAEIRNMWTYTSTALRLLGVMHRDNYRFYDDIDIKIV